MDNYLATTMGQLLMHYLSVKALDKSLEEYPIDCTRLLHIYHCAVCYKPIALHFSCIMQHCLAITHILDCFCYIFVKKI